MSEHYGTVSSPSKRPKLSHSPPEHPFARSFNTAPPHPSTASSTRRTPGLAPLGNGTAAPPVPGGNLAGADANPGNPEVVSRLWERIWEPAPNPLGGIINNNPAMAPLNRAAPRPILKQRTPAFQQPPLPPPATNGSGNGKRKAAASSVIDLTEDDDDDEVQIISNKTVPSGVRIIHPDTSEVCFGMMDKIYVSAHSLPAPLPVDDRFPNHWPMIPVKLRRHGDGATLALGASDPFGKEFGCVDVNSARVLVPLLEKKLVRVQAFVIPRKKISGNFPGPSTDYKMKSALELYANIYGPMMNLRQVSQILADKNGRFKKPSQADGLKYVAPFACSPSRVASAPPAEVMEEGAASSVLEELQKELEGLPDMEPDPRITSQLLKHQKQGLHFMTRKERDRDYSDATGNTSLWRVKRRGDSTCYRNVITGEFTAEKPAEVYGGILADVMGLGKTLQVICLIVGSLDAAAAFAAQAPPVGKIHPKRAKTTLVVCPLSIIGNWEQQINTHVKPGTLRVYIYHGPKREVNIAKLAEYDVIITTYQIAGGEFGKHMSAGDGAGPFQRINFFRIVLDEAHVIRSPTILLTRAILSLNAHRRWAVTGTPIQNRLGDLATLIKFLRIEPFDDGPIWNKYVALPFKAANFECVTNLRRIVRSVALRRSKSSITLPPRTDEVVYLEFSDAEQQLYDATIRMSRVKLDLVMKEGRVTGQNYVHVLQSILRLRLICAHGSELVGEDGTAGITSSHAIDVDELDADNAEPTWSNKEGYQVFKLMCDTGEDLCALCGTKIMAPNGGEEEVPLDKKNAVIGHLTGCAHLLCKDCGPKYAGEFDKTVPCSEDNYLRGICPLCGIYTKTALFDIKSDYNSDSTEEKPKGKKKKGKYGGPSTKVKALVAALLVNKEQGTPEDPIKSVVFSCWTSHMDLIETAFQNDGIKYVRLDGSMSRSQRNRVMDEFQDDPEISVILISIMAGGLGLNLTAACKAYVMEPQFNPAAEAQAIDRIHRLGQKRAVTTVRYIMKDSFETKIVELQNKKTELANITMSSGKLSGKEAMKRKLEDLRTLFR